MTREAARERMLSELNKRNWMNQVIQDVLNECEFHSRNISVTHEELISTACEVVDVPVSLVMGENRLRDVVTARNFIISHLRNEGYTYVYIGKLLNKNHATMIHACKSIKNLLECDKSTIEMHDNFISKLEELTNKNNTLID